MSRKRKRGRSGGGRVTPKATRPQHWDPTPSPVAAAEPDVDDVLPRLDHPAAVYRDAEASSFVAVFATDERPADTVVDLRDRGDESRLTMADVVEALANFGPLPSQRVVDTVAALAAYGRPGADNARALLRSWAADPSPAAQTLGQATIVSALRVDEIFGETVQYLFDLRYPDGEQGAVAVLIDRLMGGVVKDIMVLPDVATFTNAVDENMDAGEVTYRECSPGEAATAVEDAYRVNDRSIGIDAMVADEVDHARPMVEKLLADLPRQPRPETEPMPSEQRQAIDAAFQAWAAERHPHLGADVLDWVDLATGFVADLLGADPLKWGPNTVVAFLEHTARKVMASPAELRQVPEMLRVFLPWVHAEAGWGDRYLADSLQAIDQVMPIFEETITGQVSRGPVQDLMREVLEGVDINDPDAVQVAVDRYNASLDLSGTVAPMGGSHPEPFDAAGLGPAAGRAQQVAEAASIAARAIFDEEYVTLVRRLVADAARRDPALFARGKVDIWASGVVYAVAQLNNIVGGWHAMTMDAAELTDRLAGAHSTIGTKATAVRRTIGVEWWDPIPRYQHTATQLGFDDLYGGPFAPQPAPPPAHDRLPDDSSFLLRCQLNHVGSWRQIVVPVWITLLDLHQVLQTVFEWTDHHLHAFTIGDDHFTQNPDPGLEMDEFDDTDVRLDERVRPGTTFLYEYDFGDGWEVVITVQEVLDPDRDRPLVSLIDGVGDAPPEDCGGPPGFENLVEALSNPQHPEHRELTDWAGDWRPGSFDLDTVASMLTQATDHRP